MANAQWCTVGYAAWSEKLFNQVKEEVGRDGPHSHIGLRMFYDSPLSAVAASRKTGPCLGWHIVWHWPSCQEVAESQRARGHGGGASDPKLCSVQVGDHLQHRSSIVGWQVGLRCPPEDLQAGSPHVPFRVNEWWREDFDSVTGKVDFRDSVFLLTDIDWYHVNAVLFFVTHMPGEGLWIFTAVQLLFSSFCLSFLFLFSSFSLPLSFCPARLPPSASLSWLWATPGSRRFMWTLVQSRHVWTRSPSRSLAHLEIEPFCKLRKQLGTRG